MAKPGSTVGTLGEQIAAKTGNTPNQAVVDQALQEMHKDQQALLMLKDGYGAVECSSADGSVSERFGRKSCAVIECIVPIPLLGIKIMGTIWGRLETKADGTTVKFEASMPKGIKHIDDAGKDKLLAHIENGAVEWAGYEKATDAATAKLMGQVKAPGTVGGRPTLVKRVVMAQTAPPAN